MRVLKIVHDTIVDGPGWRTSVYLAGCRHQCPGCHNPTSWDFNSGQDIRVPTLISQILEAGNNLTLTGGDPMYQPVSVALLCSRLKDLSPINIWLYTGFTYEECLSNPLRLTALGFTDVLVDGPFIESLKSDTLMFRGSSNQRLIDVKKSLASNQVVLFDWNPYPSF